MARHSLLIAVHQIGAHTHQSRRASHTTCRAHHGGWTKRGCTTGGRARGGEACRRAWVHADDEDSSATLVSLLSMPLPMPIPLPIPLPRLALLSFPAVARGVVTGRPATLASGRSPASPFGGAKQTGSGGSRHFEACVCACVSSGTECRDDDAPGHAASTPFARPLPPIRPVAPVILVVPVVVVAGPVASALIAGIPSGGTSGGTSGGGCPAPLHVAFLGLALVFMIAPVFVLILVGVPVQGSVLRLRLRLGLGLGLLPEIGPVLEAVLEPVPTVTCGRQTAIDGLSSRSTSLLRSVTAASTFSG